MPGSTSRMQIPYPLGGEPPDVDGDMKKIADRIDVVAVMYGQGLFTDRPISTGGSPGKQGRIYFATDQNRHYWDAGTSWVPLGSAGWQTGDYKVSAVTADHADPQGGMWLKCDSSAIDGAYANLIAMVGANTPDGRGRGLWMLGTHADVNNIGDSDGESVGNRRPKHKHSITQATHALQNFSAGGDIGRLRQDTGSSGGTSGPTGVNATVGPQTGAEPTDAPSNIVVGNLFIHT